MSLEASYRGFLTHLPGVASPTGHVAFMEKLKWTGLIIIAYFLLAQMPVYGIEPSAVGQLRFLEILLGSSFGTIMSLGIGPIVTASIILQLLVGSKIIPWDTKTEDGKMIYQGTQKLLALALSFIEAFIYVNMGAVPAASADLAWLVIVQLAAGGILALFMDEVISKWGLGSGVSLFIAGGVAKTMLVRSFNPLTTTGGFPGLGNPPAGLIPFAITSIVAGDIIQAFLSLLPLIATVLVFLVAVYSNALRVEIPLAFGSVRGFGRRWPLRFFYTSNIPVILVGALLANVSLFGVMLANSGNPLLGTFDAQGQATGGLAYFMTVPRSEGLSFLFVTVGIFGLAGALLAFMTKRSALPIIAIAGVVGVAAWFGIGTATGLGSLIAIPPIEFARVLSYTFILTAGATLFSYFWMNTSGMDPKTVSGQLSDSGMQIPGYRSDPRIMESVLNRYIPGLTILGGAAIGLLASFADITNAIGTGTGMLLATMIIFQLYEQLSSQYLEEMPPVMRRFFE